LLALCHGGYLPKTALEALANLQSEVLALPKAFPRRKSFSSTETEAKDTLTNPMPLELNR
jgi:hypothetical protein